MILSFFQCMFVITVKPFDSKARNFQETFNEIFVLLSSYLIIFFSKYNWDTKANEIGGYAFASVISLTVLFNVTILVVVTVKQCVHNCKMKKFRAKTNSLIRNSLVD